jgi:probable F420-dependent oxidoreductase
MTPFFNPGPIEHPRIPIYIAAVNPYMAQMAGEICDGLHVHSFHSPKYLREVIRPAVEVGLGKSGRPRKDFTFRASTMVVVGDDADELERSRRAVKQQIAFYASTRTYQAVLAVHGLDHLVPQLHAKSLEGDWGGMADLISDETLDHFAVTATWGTLGARLRERYDGICDRTQLYPAFQPSLDDPRLQALIKEMNRG